MMRLRSLFFGVGGLLLGLSGFAQGWRGDGTGAYPESKLPQKWSTSEGLVWKTTTEKWSNASPVVVGDKLFICEEPSTLVCVNAADGKILWRKSVPYEATFSAADAVKFKEMNPEAEKLQKELDQVNRKSGGIRRKLKKDPKNEELKKQVDELKKQQAELNKKLKPFQKYLIPKCHNVTGYSSPTPVSDGKVVAVLFGTGAAAVFDLSGNQLWLRSVGKPSNGWGHSSSPIIADGKLLVHVGKLMGLDLENGKTLWEANSRVGWGSPVKAKVGGKEYVIVQSGDIVDPSDGKIVARKLNPLEYNAPVVVDDVVYFIQGRSSAFKLSMEGDKLKAEKLWEQKIKKDRYYASPVVHNGLVFAVTQKNEYTVLDAKTGEVKYSKKLDLGRCTVYPSVTLIGDTLMVSGDNGTVLLLAPAAEYKELGKVSFEAFRSSPTGFKESVIIRGLKNLYRIGG